MKIGQFATQCKVSVDTIRYYMELMLIIPDKVGGQYEFKESCQSDIEEILWLKSAHFSLKEIQKIFSLKRFTNLKADEDVEYYKRLFENKKQELVDRKFEIDKIINKIDDKLKVTDIKTNHENVKLGVPFDFLSMLSCPKCKSNMRLQRGSIEDNLIMNGNLKCSCGFELKIHEGIIVSENDCKEPLYYEDELKGHFIEQTSSQYVNLLYKSGQWVTNKLDLKNTKNPIILEPGTGSGIFLNSILRELPEEALYICIDNNLELLTSTKKNIEKHYSKYNIIFICCDFLNIPIKEASIDILLDHFGTSNYNFFEEGFLINLIDGIVKPGGKWIGDYFSFKREAKSLLQFDEKYRKYYYIENIKKAIENSHFKTIEMKELGSTEKGGIYEKFFIEGDTLYDFVYYGEKLE